VDMAFASSCAASLRKGCLNFVLSAETSSLTLYSLSALP